MLCATKVLKPGPARIGSIGAGITLPRTVPVPVLIAAAVGTLLGLGLGLVVFDDFSYILITGVLGGAAGWVAVNYSPLRGESLGRWASLEVTSRLRSVRVNGQVARVYVGVCLVPDVAAGEVRIVPGAFNVKAGTVDERGRFVDAAIPLTAPPPSPYQPTTAHGQAPSPGWPPTAAPASPSPPLAAGYDRGWPAPFSTPGGVAAPGAPAVDDGWPAPFTSPPDRRGA
jgi:hypothetical protein